MKNSRASANRQVPARLAVAILIALFLGACATTPPAQDETRVIELIDLINSGPVHAVVAQSSAPFLFDAEIVVLDVDIEAIWTALRSADFVVSSSFDAMSPAEPGDFSRVSDSFDVQTFFSEGRYLPSDATLVETDSSLGGVILILGGRSGSLPLIHGLVRVDR